ncbi:hypothetical protein [uncultured Dubosiella sp.]|uniref:hypothetical protein n=1 Tax=uncultured Dubosiella sp. TaxID=1937011 RepID=UPI00258A4800|nr:hypothetical protein [uncultured Dubosiella sp.]
MSSILACMAISFCISFIVSWVMMSFHIYKFNKVYDCEMEKWMAEYQKTTNEILKKAGLLK